MSEPPAPKHTQDDCAEADYQVPDGAAEEVLGILVGDGDKLFDPRYPGVLDTYNLIDHRESVGGVIAVLRHRTKHFCLELDVRATSLNDAPGASWSVADILATLGRPTIQYDPQDRGAFEAFSLLSRRRQGQRTHMIVRHRKTKRDVEVSIAVRPAGPSRGAQD